jgi:hypothetical protein
LNRELILAPSFVNARLAPRLDISRNESLPVSAFLDRIEDLRLQVSAPPLHLSRRYEIANADLPVRGERRTKLLEMMRLEKAGQPQAEVRRLDWRRLVGAALAYSAIPAANDCSQLLRQ